MRNRRLRTPRKGRGDVLTQAQRQYCMGRIRGKDTKPELALRRTLWALGYRYRVHSKLPGRPDILFINKKVAVFVDGCFWHCCPSHFTMPKTNTEFWRKKLAGNRRRDRAVSVKLHRLGFKVIRIWEHEIRKSPINPIGRIVKQLGTP